MKIEVECDHPGTKAEFTWLKNGQGAKIVFTFPLDTNEHHAYLTAYGCGYVAFHVERSILDLDKKHGQDAGTIRLWAETPEEKALLGLGDSAVRNLPAPKLLWVESEYRDTYLIVRPDFTD